MRSVFAPNANMESLRPWRGPIPPRKQHSCRSSPTHRETRRAGDGAYIRKDEVLSLLKAAAAGVPADSLRSKSGKPGPGPSRLRKRRPTWRSAGARGAEGTDVTAVVYWKQ